MVWEDVTNLPFTQEIKDIIKNVNWQEYEWHVMGLPQPLAKYNMSGGKLLYMTELANGESKLLKMSEFTGNVLMAGFFVDEANKEGYNYFVQFIVTILKGEVVEVQVSKINKQPVQEYLSAMQDFNKGMRRVMEISDAWWFKWLYRPWFFTVRGIGFLVLLVVHGIRIGLISVINFLTPL